jgi:hypothetical protein
MRKKNFTYNDWLSGRAVINSRLFIPFGEKPYIVEWVRFNEAEKVQIKAKQKALFQDSVNETLEKFQLIFNENHERSEDKNEFLKSELKQCMEVFTSVISPSSFFSTTFWDAVFTHVDIIEIQRFYKNVIIRGQEIDLDFIQPPKSIFVNKDYIHPEVYCLALWRYYKWLNEYSPTKTIQTRIDFFVKKITEFGYFNLPKVKALENENALLIVTHSFKSGFPYSIAMFDYLDFFNYLIQHHFQSKAAMHKEVAKWFNVSPDGRSVRGNINVLIPNTMENKTKYTSHSHKEQVIKDYEQLKSGVPLTKSP